MTEADEPSAPFRFFNNKFIYTEGKALTFEEVVLKYNFNMYLFARIYMSFQKFFKTFKDGFLSKSSLPKLIISVEQIDSILLHNFC